MDDLQMQDDETLMLLLLEEDQDALAEILRRYGRRVRGYLKVTFGDVLREPEHHAVFNEAAYNLWRFRERFKPESGSLKAWFMRIAYNAAVSMLRREKKHLAKDLEYDPEYSPADCPEEKISDYDSKEQKLLEALRDFIHNKLVGFEREIAIDFYKSGGGSDVTRLAQIHGKTKGNVSATRTKVKKKMIEFVEQYEARQRDRKGSS